MSNAPLHPPSRLLSVLDPPAVTLILPIRNEARYIARCLDAVANQDYPRDLIEILVCDGMSEDDTREIVHEYIEKDARVHLIDNPKRIVPTALNLGLSAARGQVIVRVDGHAVIARDYVLLCVEDLAKVEAACVGGPIETVGETMGARGIAIAQSSPFGVGGAAFRWARTAQYVDTLAFGAYRREVFEQVGLFDEELVRNQDDEFNLRLLRAGGRIWLDPRIRSTYYSRATLGGLWKQYFEYGFWKVRVIQKQRWVPSLRSLVPALLIFVLMASGLASLTLHSFLPFGLVSSVYLSGVLLAALWESLRRAPLTLPVVFIAFPILHLAYGVGFWWGLVRWNVKT